MRKFLLLVLACLSSSLYARNLSGTYAGQVTSSEGPCLVRVTIIETNDFLYLSPRTYFCESGKEFNLYKGTMYSWGPNHQQMGVTYRPLLLRNGTEAGYIQDNGLSVISRTADHTEISVFGFLDANLPNIAWVERVKDRFNNDSIVFSMDIGHGLAPIPTL